MKKLILAICLLLLFAVNVTALTVDQITPDEDFIIYSAAPQEVAKALDTNITDLETRVKEQNILFLAVNGENTKQIQLTCNETQFSQTVGNLSNLSDSSIKNLLPDITGIQNIKGNIVLKNNQKYVNINLKTEEQGYTLTQYFTVDDNKLYTLSFYTNENESTDYIETAFTTSTKLDEDIKLKKAPTAFRIAVICGTIIFGIAFFIILFNIIRDLIKKR